MKRYNLKANAKLNLFININKKLDNGYHDLSMINIMINLADLIKLEIDDNGSGIKIIDLNNTDMPTNSKNLIWKVIEHFKKIEKKQFGIVIKIAKEIPTQSGTGGASSDAAAIIKALYEHFEISQSNNELIKKYNFLGADIAFFIVNQSAIVRGCGEVIEPCNLNLSKFNFILIHPNFKNSTENIYQKINFNLMEKEDLLQKNITNLQKYDFGCLKNDFYEVVDKQSYQEIFADLTNLGANYVNITGTGSTVFGIFKKELNSKQIINELNKKYRHVYLCKQLGGKNA